MQKYSGLIVNPGIAYGKALILKSEQDFSSTEINGSNQMEILNNALSKSATRLEEQIQSSHMLYSDRISTIFEAHKLMISDPMLLDKAKQYILSGNTAYDAYKQAAQEAIDIFKHLSSEYMRNRAIDIEDATDRVLYTIQEENYEISCSFDDAKILILEKMKPSVLYNFNKECVFGFISKTGSYNQHSALIARTKNIPGVILDKILDLGIQDGDMILLDAYRGDIYIKPDIELVNKILEERR
ncbi:MAG: hypothetical protein KKE16_05910 [Firmicutes bacterium]|nr:hypothetical protein [Bacillota bacterium]